MKLIYKALIGWLSKSGGWRNLA